jgi:hypothetical protein
MLGETLLLAIIGFPLFLGLLFRVSTSHLFFSLMAGELLGRYFGRDLESFTASLTHWADLPHYSEAMLIILPMILTAVFLHGSLTKGKALLHILPLAVTGVIAAAFLVPILPHFLQEAVRSWPPGDWFLHLNKTIIGTMIAVQLIALWLLTGKEPNSKNRRRN